MLFLTPADPVYNEIPDYSNTQKFNMWLRMEKECLKKTRWIDELNDRKCPATLQEIERDGEENPKSTVWEKPSDNPKVSVFHWGLLGKFVLNLLKIIMPTNALTIKIKDCSKICLPLVVLILRLVLNRNANNITNTMWLLLYWRKN